MSSAATYDVAGDQLYVDARILKWHYWANVLGLHTLYALDRAGGRYADLEDELHQPRTLYALGPRRPVRSLQVDQGVQRAGTARPMPNMAAGPSST